MGVHGSNKNWRYWVGFNVRMCLSNYLLLRTCVIVVKQDILASYVESVKTNCITGTSQEQDGKKTPLLSAVSIKKKERKSVMYHRMSRAGSAAHWRKWNGAWRGWLKSSVPHFKRQEWVMTHKSQENDRSLFFCQQFKPKRTAIVMSDVLMMPP